MREHADRQEVQLQARCLMANHLVAVPEREDYLAPVIGEAHRLYTRAGDVTAIDVLCPRSTLTSGRARGNG